MRALILHGDDRSLHLKDIFLQNGHIVDYRSDLSDIIPQNDYDVAVLPVPLVDINPYMNLLDSTKIGKIIYASNDKKIIKYLRSHHCFNIFDDEDLVFYNARLTAEAALAIAIGNGKQSLYGSSCLVCGFGRIGILLAALLSAAGAKVDVATGNAANSKVLTAMDVGYRLYDSLQGSIENYDFIFNTVPFNIFKPEDLINYSGIYYELASMPYGFSHEEIGFSDKRLLCSKLPGKYFPHSAALGIYEAILKNI